MTMILQAEWMRFIRNRVNLLIVAGTLLVLGASALWSGYSAAQYREQAAQRQAQWQERAAAREREWKVSGDETDEIKAARQAFDLARGDPPPAQRPALGGLALSVRHFIALPHEIKVSVESRHTDGRKSDPVTNPLLDSIGLPDFAVVLALLLPLMTIGLAYGMVQEGREQGVWRLVCSQCRQPWRVLFHGLLLRFCAAFAVAGMASLLAFGLDPGATSAAFVWWMLAVALFCAIWTLIAGLFSLVRISSAAAALGMLGLWLLTTFAIPPALQWSARTAAPAASRLDAVVAIRSAQQNAEVRMAELLEEWYRAHPSQHPKTVTSHTWPVSFIPRFLEQDREILPLMDGFDRRRAQQLEAVERASWLAPGLALVLVADRLAGADAAHHARYQEEVNRFEQEWRRFFVPRIMSYRGLSVADLSRVPVYRSTLNEENAIKLPLLLSLFVLAVLLAAVLFAVRRGSARP